VHYSEFQLKGLFKAAILVEVLLIGLIDNLLRPILVGRDTRMPDYLVLLSTLGGLTISGAETLVMGVMRTLAERRKKINAQRLA